MIKTQARDTTWRGSAIDRRRRILRVAAITRVRRAYRIAQSSPRGRILVDGQTMRSLGPKAHRSQAAACIMEPAIVEGTPSRKTCPICAANTIERGVITGKFVTRRFSVRTCPKCYFAYVANPWTDYATIYTLDYYAGRGVDPYVDYFSEIAEFDMTVRRYEWRGITTALRSLIRLDGSTNWLDFGCGTGGLVRYGRETVGCNVIGYEEGAIGDFLVAHRIPTLSRNELEGATASFDVITAIEVLEHLADPLATLRRLRSMLKPGGLFFYTTGNSRPFRRRLLQWRYLIPEIHVSLFEPLTMAIALSQTGFAPEDVGFRPGYEDIVRFKVLKNLHVKRRSRWEEFLPWAVISRLVNARYGLMAHPIGWAA
jgi:SAM-dependent methyltransferase